MTGTPVVKQSKKDFVIYFLIIFNFKEDGVTGFWNQGLSQRRSLILKCMFMWIPTGTILKSKSDNDLWRKIRVISRIQSIWINKEKKYSIWLWANNVPCNILKYEFHLCVKRYRIHDVDYTTLNFSNKYFIV